MCLTLYKGFGVRFGLHHLIENGIGVLRIPQGGRNLTLSSKSSSGTHSSQFQVVGNRSETCDQFASWLWASHQAFLMWLDFSIYKRGTVKPCKFLSFFFFFKGPETFTVKILARSEGSINGSHHSWPSAGASSRARLPLGPSGQTGPASAAVVSQG